MPKIICDGLPSQTSPSYDIVERELDLKSVPSLSWASMTNYNMVHITLFSSQNGNQDTYLILMFPITCSDDIQAQGPFRVSEF